MASWRKRIQQVATGEGFHFGKKKKKKSCRRWEVDPTHLMAPKNKTKKEKMWFVTNLRLTETPGINTTDFIRRAKCEDRGI